MGRRSGTETLVALLMAFLRQRSWTQAELAREVGVDSRTVRARLLELETSGVPLESEVEHPHVYWSVPRDWFPGGILISSDDATELLRQLARAPRSRGRDKLLERLLRALPARSAFVDPTSAVISPVASEGESAWLSVAEDAVASHRAMRVHYFSAKRGALEWRHVSPQIVAVARPARFVAVCHRSGDLKWFRIDNVMRASIDDGEPYRARPAAEVRAFIDESLDGFHGEAPVPCSFVVRDPDSRWVERNLLEGARVARIDGGIRVECTTTAVVRLAQYVVGLGGAATAETEELAKLVRELAEGALKSATPVRRARKACEPAG